MTSNDNFQDDEVEEAMVAAQVATFVTIQSVFRTLYKDSADTREYISFDRGLTDAINDGRASLGPVGNAAVNEILSGVTKR